MQPALPAAVRHFQDMLIARRNDAAVGLAAVRASEEARLTGFRKRFDLQVQREFDAVMTNSQKIAQERREEREQEVDRLFTDWSRWIVEDANPYVDVVAVFHG
jgi:hypothetical protein